MVTAWGTITSGLRRAPMFRAAVPFAAGLMFGRAVEPTTMSAWWFAVIMVAGTVAVLALHHAYPQRWVRGAVLPAGMAALGVLWWSLRGTPAGLGSGELEAVKGRPWLVRIGEPSYVGQRTARYEALVIGMHGAPDITSGRKVYLTVEIGSAQDVPVRGDLLWTSASLRRIDRIPDPGGFDRRGYAATRGIALEAYATETSWTFTGHHRHWTDAFAEARTVIATWLQASGLAARERALAKALLIGVRDELEQDQKLAFARSGTMHVLAVSGMHVGLIWAVLSALLARMGNRTAPRVIRGCLILLALWAYAGLTGAEASVLRATVMCSLFTLAGMVLRASDHLNSLFAAAFVLLLWDPLMLWQLGFQLSFLAVLGIILFYGPILRMWEPRGAVLHYAWSAVAVSLAAQVATTPLSLFVFKAFPIWFLPANVLVVGMVTLAVYGSVLLIVLFKVPVVGAAIVWCMQQLLVLLGWSTAFFAELPGAYPSVRIDAWMCVLLYAWVLVAATWIAWPGRWARWGTAVIGIVLLGGWAIQAHHVNHAARLVVHGTYGGDLLSAQHGRALTLLADTATLNDAAFPSRIEAQQRSTGATTVQRSVLPGTGRSTAVDVGAFRIGIAAPDDLEGGSALPVDVLLITGDGRFHMEEVIGAFSPRHGIVVSSTLNGLERWRIARWCAENGIQCHDVRRQGAFILERRM